MDYLHQQSMAWRYQIPFRGCMADEISGTVRRPLGDENLNKFALDRFLIQICFTNGLHVSAGTISKSFFQKEL